MSNPDFTFKEVPPPDDVPVDQLGAALGLCDGLRAETTDFMYRCGCCNQMQRPGSYIVHVPYCVLPGDPAWSVSEHCRRGAYNGMYDGWCIDCAPRREGDRRRKDLGKPHVGFWDRLFMWMTP